MALIYFLFIFILPPTFAATDLCDVLDIPNCRGITKQFRRNTFQSAPTSATATNLNPSNLRFDKGLGVEAIAQASNPVLFGLASGTGKMGGALITGSMDNSFFGNRVPELDEQRLDRFQDDRQYKNQKVTAALGGRLLAKKNYGLDVGAIVKRHHEIKKINAGAGLSARLWLFHLGASTYRDDYNLDMTQINRSSGLPYSIIFGKEKYQESFTVNTYTLGMRIKNLSFDLASINSKLDHYEQLGVPETRILIYAGSFYYGNFLLNAAVRKEESGAKSFVTPPDSLKIEENKSFTFYSLQYSFGKHVVFGVSYNYFLLKELSATLSLFI